MYMTMKICHRPYTIQRVETGREGGRVPVTDPLPPGWAPERNGHFKCLRESSGSLALALHSWRGQGRKGWWGSGSCRSPVPCLTWTIGPQVLAPGGRGRGPAFCPAPAVRLS